MKIFVFLLSLFVSTLAGAQQSTINVLLPISKCESTQAIPCVCTGPVNLATGKCTTGNCPSGEACMAGRLFSSDVRQLAQRVKTEIQELMDRDVDNPSAFSIPVYSGTGGAKQPSACTIQSGNLICVGEIQAQINDSSNAALVGVQAGSGPSLFLLGGPARLNYNTTLGGQVDFYEGTNNGQNKVTLRAPASLTNDNTITFTATGKLPASSVDSVVTGPTSSTGGALAYFADTTGGVIASENNWTTGGAGKISATCSESVIESCLTITGGLGYSLKALNGDGYGLSVDGAGTTSLSNSFSTSPPLVVRQSGGGSIAIFTDNVSNGTTTINDGGAISVVNDSSGNQAALAIQQNHNSAAIATFLNGTDSISGMTLSNGGGLTVTTTSTTATTVPLKGFQNSTGAVMVLQTNTTANDPTTVTWQKRVVTTDATATDAFALPLSTGQICHIECTVVASCTGGGSCTAGTDGGSAKIAGVFNNIAGTTAQISTTTTIHSKFSKGWTATFAVATDSAKCQVNGLSSMNVTWHATIAYSCLAS